MLDFRAWIIAGLILLTAAGAYIVWITRARAGYHARSLSAAPHPANPAKQPVTKSLHVEGCSEDFIVNPGELVEPRAVPGASLDQFRGIYGKEKQQDASGALTWSEEAYSLTAGSISAKTPADSVRISLKTGHVLETLDGIELGLDSFGTIFRKMQDKKVEVRERLVRGDGNWTLIVSMYSACGRKFRSEYARTLLSDAEIDREITSLPPSPGLDPGVLRSDVFMNKVVYDYALVPSNGSNGSTAGSPSEHD